jgi:membrane protein YdbS with pleckstrin-like domain
MRFSTKVDRWLAVVLSISAILTFIVPLAALLLALVRRQPIHWMAGALVAVWVVALFATLPQYYELRAEGLYIRQGWRKSLVLYGSILSVESTTSTVSAGVYSSDRVQIETASQGSYLIAPVNRPLFLDKLTQRAPFASTSPGSILQVR